MAVGGKSLLLSNQLLALIFAGVPIPGLADNIGSGALGVFSFSLHTDDPGIGGWQTEHEAAYGSYARVQILRQASAWIFGDGFVSPAAQVDFPAATSGDTVVTWFSVGTQSSGPGLVLYRGALSPGVRVLTGVQPYLSTSTIIREG